LGDFQVHDKGPEEGIINTRVVILKKRDLTGICREGCESVGK
jgi:hypothetical protein